MAKPRNSILDITPTTDRTRGPGTPPVATSDRLADALAALDLAKMSERARRGVYDDFKSEHAQPIAALVRDLEEAASLAAVAGQVDRAQKIRELADQARAGGFDATREEADTWFKAEGGGL